MKMVYNEYRDFQQTREDKMVNLRMPLDMFSDATRATSGPLTCTSWTT